MTIEEAIKALEKGYKRYSVIVEPVPSIKLVSGPLTLLGAVAWFLASWLRLTPAAIVRWTPPKDDPSSINPDRLAEIEKRLRDCEAQLKGYRDVGR